MAPTPIAFLVADIAEQVARLAPSHRDPEGFHIQKSEVAHKLRRLARELRRSAP